MMRLRLLTDETVSLLAMALRIGSGAILLPILLTRIPPEQMGIWYVFLSLGALAPIFDMGFSASLARFAAVYQAGAQNVTAQGLPDIRAGCSPNLGGIARLYAVAKRIYLVAGLLMATTLAVLGPLLVFDQRKPEMALVSGSLAWWSFLLASGSLIYAQFPNTILRGMGQIIPAQLIQIQSIITHLAVVSTLIWLDVGIASLSLGMLANSVFVGILSRKKLRELGVSKGAGGGPELFRQLLPNSWRTGLISVGGYLIIHANTLLCGRFLSLEETAAYGLASQLVGLIEGAAGVFVAVKAPALTRFSASGEIDKLRSTFFRALAFGMAFFMTGATAIIALAPAALVYIGSKTALLPLPMLLFFLGYRLLEFHHVQYATLVMSSNQVPFAWPAVASGVLILFVGFFSVAAWGLWGLLLTAATVQLLVNNWYPVVLGLRMLRSR
jgi:O-antigen/teichoic acid export membrane protein